MAGLDTVLETTEAQRPATGFVFTEGPLWHPDDFYYFADVRASKFYRLKLGGSAGDRAQRHRRGQRHDL